MNRRAFTLIELTVVMAIIALALTMAVGAHYSWRRQAVLDAAEARASALLSLARQTAIASGRPVLFAFGNGPVPYDDDNPLSPFLDLSAPQTNAAAGWCSVVTLTNAWDETDAWEIIDAGDPLPLASDVATFGEPVLWGDIDAIDEDGSCRFLLFLPDGGTAADNGNSSQAGPTNVLYGVVDGDLGQRKRKASQTRVLETLPFSGATRALSREERVSLFGSEP